MRKEICNNKLKEWKLKTKNEITKPCTYNIIKIMKNIKQAKSKTLSFNLACDFSLYF